MLGKPLGLQGPGAISPRKTYIKSCNTLAQTATERHRDRDGDKDRKTQTATQTYQVARQPKKETPKIAASQNSSQTGEQVRRRGGGEVVEKLSDTNL